MFCIREKRLRCIELTECFMFKVVLEVRLFRYLIEDE
jgi:hypothetical protein